MAWEGRFRPSATEYAHKSFSVWIKFPDTCLVSGDTSTPRDPSVFKRWPSTCINSHGAHFQSCIFNPRVLQPKRVLMELREMSDGSASFFFFFCLPRYLGSLWRCITQMLAHFDSANITRGWVEMLQGGCIILMMAINVITEIIKWWGGFRDFLCQYPSNWWWWVSLCC